MKISKAVVLGLVCIMMVGVIAGCGNSKGEEKSDTTVTEKSELEEKEKVIIGWALSDFDDKFLSYILNAAQEEADNLSDVAEVIFVDAKDDSAKQLAQIENFISQGVDVICVVPVNTDATEPLTTLANEAGIPIISVNRVFKNQEEATSNVGSNSIEAGRIQMEYVGELLNGKGKILILRGGDGHEATVARTEGIKQVIDEKYPDIEVMAEQTGKWDRAEAMRVMENWIQSGMEFDAVICNNDEMAIGAIMALGEAKMIDDVIVAGIDATPDALEFMKQGTLACTVFQDASGQGAGSVKAAYKAAIGETIEEQIYIPFELVTPDLIDTYLTKWE